MPSTGIRVSPLPSGRITFSHGANRMYCPSGDHAANCPNVLVRRCWSVPSAFITYGVCHGPTSPVVRQSSASEYAQSSRTEEKTMYRPSDDHAGQPSEPGDVVS